MNPSHVKLKEIIWEITGRCENGCKHCGSSDVWTEKINEGKILKIAKAISNYPPEEIDISGGDPLLVSSNTHSTILNIFRRKGMKCKIIVNPKSLLDKRRSKDGEYWFLTNKKFILSQYDWVGISVNNADEVSMVEAFLQDKKKFPKKITIISNFNLENIFDYLVIESFVLKHKIAWQVQYTMFREEDCSLAIYNNVSSFNHFSELIRSSLCKGAELHLADNLNCGLCSAGLFSIGILSDGDVVPCLSMRAWIDPDQVVQGNILSRPLEEIWMNEFKEYRFSGFHCCKDHCRNRQLLPAVQIPGTSITPTEIIKEDELIKPASPWVQPKIDKPETPPDDHPGTYAYAVPGGWKERMIMYGVFSGPSTTDNNFQDSSSHSKVIAVYAVFNDSSSTGRLLPGGHKRKNIP